MGLFWRVVRKYQMERHMISSDSKNLNPAERVKGLKEILSLLKEEFTRILVKPDQVPKLDAAFTQTINTYSAAH